MAGVLPREVQKACTMGGLQQKVSDVKQRVATLEDLEKTLEVAIRDCEQAATQEMIFRGAEICAKLIAVAADIIIAEMEDKLPPQARPVGKAIGVIYDASKLIVDAANGDLDLSKAILYNGGVKLDVIAYALQERSAKHAQLVGRAKTFINVSYDLIDFVMERGSDLTAKSGINAAKATAIKQLQGVRFQIKTIKAALAECNAA